MYTDPTGWTTQISLNAIYLSISSYASGKQFNSSTGYEFIANATEKSTDGMNLCIQDGGGDPFNNTVDAKAYDDKGDESGTNNELVIDKWYKISLGDDDPDLFYKVKYSNEYDPNWGSKYQLVIRVYGKKYKDYNWVQTYSHNNKIGVDGENDDGFQYGPPGDEWREYYANLYQGDANMFFEDSPNALSFEAELSLVGQNEWNCWENVGSFTWGFKLEDGRMQSNPLEINSSTSLYHSLYVYFSIYSHNQ